MGLTATQMLIFLSYAQKTVLLHKCTYCFKFATIHKFFCQACPLSILVHFSQGAIPESLVEKKVHNWQSYSAFVETMYFLYSIGLINFNKCWINLSVVNFWSTKLSGIEPCEKCTNILGGHADNFFFLTFSKFEAMVIYIVKQASGHDIWASV